MTTSLLLEQPAAEQADLTFGDGLELDVTLVEKTDGAGLIEMTDDGCGSTCGACVTNAA